MTDIKTLRETLEDAMQTINSVAAEIEALRLNSERDAAHADMSAIVDLCADCERAATRAKHSATRKRDTYSAPASTQRMVSFIVNEVMRPEEPTMKKKTIIPGGIEAAVLRRAEGKCELCKTEFHLSPHHIIPRSDGGLTNLDNLIALCKRCHDEVEDQGYRTRAEVLRHERRTTPRPPTRTEDEQRSIAEKAAATRAANVAKQRTEAEELAEWDAQYSGFWKYVPYIKFGDPIPAPRPWEIVVYGGGKSALKNL